MKTELAGYKNITYICHANIIQTIWLEENKEIILKEWNKLHGS